VAEHDGNGWVECRCGARHWGRHGAAGLLLLRGPQPGDEAGGRRQVLLQLRAAWTHQGGSWGLLGGARDSHEDAVAAALREAAEEAGVSADTVVVLGQLPGVDHGDWRYTYVLALAGGPMDVGVLTAETDELRWVALEDVERLPLHPAFGDAWPRLHAGLLSDGRAVLSDGSSELSDGSSELSDGRATDRPVPDRPAGR
jgi:8-oxo-dGTP diphosphatase